MTDEERTALLSRLPVNYNELHWTERKAIREEYVRRQEGNCCYCGEPLSGKAAEHVMARRIAVSLFPEHFFDWPVHLHHDHETGMTIGAVHCHCNAVMWQYEGK